MGIPLLFIVTLPIIPLISPPSGVSPSAHPFWEGTVYHQADSTDVQTPGPQDGPEWQETKYHQD